MELQYPVTRWVFFGDWDDKPRKQIYTHAYNDNYSHRNNGGIILNSALGFETKKEACESRLKFLANKRERMERELKEIDERILYIRNIQNLKEASGE